MDKIKIIVGIILFGSIWGLTESIIGPTLINANLPSGALLTSIFAIPSFISRFSKQIFNLLTSFLKNYFYRLFKKSECLFR